MFVQRAASAKVEFAFEFPAGAFFDDVEDFERFGYYFGADVVAGEDEDFAAGGWDCAVGVGVGAVGCHLDCSGSRICDSYMRARGRLREVGKLECEEVGQLRARKKTIHGCVDIQKT